MRGCAARQRDPAAGARAAGVAPDARYVELREPDDRNYQIYQEFFDLYKSIYSYVQDDFKSLQSLLKRTSS
jgi:hypothetical protein